MVEYLQLCVTVISVKTALGFVHGWYSFGTFGKVPFFRGQKFEQQA